MRSIIQPEKDFCYICSNVYQKYYLQELEEHHIFGGPDRTNSERCGLKVYLCRSHHREGPEAAHQNRITNLWLKERAQRIFEEKHSREEFVEIFKKNYL